MQVTSVIFILQLLTTVFDIACCTNTLRNSGEKPNSGSSYSPVKNGVPEKEYAEYPDYDAKMHSPSRTELWDNSPAESKDSMTQFFSGTQNTPYKKLPSKSGLAKLKLVPNWPDSNTHLGQVAGVDIDAKGNVVVFHRGDRTWGSQTFAFNNIYMERELGPIQQNCVIVFDATSGLVLNKWGSNVFYLPHGLTIDFEDNIWVTDVALHQVFKFPANSDKASITLGVPFTPGNDDVHFCKPTDVAVMTNGDFFVSDGYCNSRIIKFDKSGNKLMEWGRSTLSVTAGLSGKPPPDHFQVPHALAIAEEKEILFVADRENGRVQCFNTSSGIFIRQLHSHSMGPRIFSVAYAPVHGGLLYIVNGPAFGDTSVKVTGFVLSLATVEFVAHFNSDDNGFQNPHDVAVTKDGSQVYTVELNPFKVWKFVQGNLNLSSSAVITKAENGSIFGNISSASQTVSNEKVSTLTADAGAIPIKSSITQSKGSVAAMIAAIASVIVVIIVALTVIVIRIRRGSSKLYDELNNYYD